MLGLVSCAFNLWTLETEAFKFEANLHDIVRLSQKIATFYVKGLYRTSFPENV